jgi:DNA polymerase III sliding clamp (beta) subunit (PCNA family)
MKITTRREALFGQLQTVTRAASTRSAVQALSGVQLLARTGEICACRWTATSYARARSCFPPA